MTNLTQKVMKNLENMLVYRIETKFDQQSIWSEKFCCNGVVASHFLHNIIFNKCEIIKYKYKERNNIFHRLNLEIGHRCIVSTKLSSKVPQKLSSMCSIQYI